MIFKLQKHYKCLFLLMLILALLWNSNAYAALDPNVTVDRIVTVFRDNTVQWQGVLVQYALGLFWLLAGIEFTFTAFKLALRGADLYEFLGELVNRILYIGLFLTLLMNSAAWSTAIVESFRTAAGAASGSPGINPGNILGLAMQIVVNLAQHTSVLEPIDAVLSSLCAISIMVCFALMAANMIEALIESYIVISAGVILMGFGGASWTNDFARKPYIYAISAGLKLFLIQLLMGLGQTLVQQLAAEFDGGSLEDALVMVGVAVTMWVVTLNIPNKFQALVNGVSFGHGTLAGVATGAIGATTAVAAGLASGGVKTMVGAGMAAQGGYRAASERLKASNGSPTNQPRLAALTGEALKATVGESVKNLGERFRGERRFGNMGAQVGHELNQEANRLKEIRLEAESNGKSTPEPSKSNPINRIYPQQKED